MAHGRYFILPILSSTVSPQHEASRDHVVQRLLFLGEPRQEVSDKCGHQVGDDLAKVPSRGAPEAHALSRHIRDHQTQRPFPDRGLPLGTLQQRVVQPCQKQAHRGGKKYECDEHEDADIIQLGWISPRNPPSPVNNTSGINISTNPKANTTLSISSAKTRSQNPAYSTRGTAAYPA